MSSGHFDIDLDTAFARFKTLRSAVNHRPWKPGMPMEQALDELGTTLRELERTRRELSRLREEAGALREQRDEARRARADLEERLVALQKMDAVARLAGGIAHDFNNLLLIIMGRAELLLELLAEGDRARKHAREIRKAGKRASALARQLLAFSRPKGRRARELDSSAALAEIREMLELVVGDEISLELRLDPTAGAIAIERGELEQIVLNLAMNARDAMPGGGRLTISTERVDMRTTESATRDVAETAYVAIKVADTGVGMDPATQARVFEPYFTTKMEGTGLGLASVHRIVGESRGWIVVESAPGEGSSFEVFLPRAGDSVETRPRVREPCLARIGSGGD